MIPKHIFKAYDIRGLVETEVTDELAEQIGRAFASLLHSEVEHRPLTVAVGRDMRESSQSLQEALMRGLTQCGVHVKNVGLVSTPAFYFSVGHVEADGGVMISASHNPAEYNGFKLCRAKAVPVGGDSGILQMADWIEEASSTGGGPGLQAGEVSNASKGAEAKEVGTIESIKGIPALAAEAEIAFADQVTLKPLKIVADSGNGMGAQYLDELFKNIEADVTRMFWEFDGTFPNHSPDPSDKENLVALGEKVRKTGADLGIATDGDGDRIFFVDDEGEMVPPAVVRGLLARVMLRQHPGAVVCYDIRPGKITEDMIVEAGGSPCITRVGHSLIKAKMRQENAIFGGESSGHFFYKFPNGTFEGPVVAALHVLSELVQSNGTLSQMVKPLKEKYSNSGEINFRVQQKDTAIKAVKEKYADGELSELDGITVTYDTFWFNIRPSNTEPFLRLNLEAVDQQTMESKRDELSTLIQTFSA